MVHWFNFTRRFKENFVVSDKLGEGAYGCTYRCMEKATGQWYAVKVLGKSSIDTDDDKEAVMKEVKILRTVSPQNENIVTLFGVFEDEESVYLLLELCTGGELFDVIKEKGSFSEARTRPPLAPSLQDLLCSLPPSTQRASRGLCFQPPSRHAPHEHMSLCP